MSHQRWRLPVADGFIGGITNDGTGPDLLFVPGVGHSSMSWSTLMDQLPGFRSTALDPRGTAQSIDAPLLEAGEGWRDVLAVVDGLALDRPVLVCHGTGGFQALAAAADRPDLVAAVVTIEAPLPDGPRPDIFAMMREVYSEEMIDALAARFGFGQVFGSPSAVDEAVAGLRDAVAHDWMLSEVTADLSEELRYIIVERPDGSWLRTPDRAAVRAGYGLDVDAPYFPSAELYGQVRLPVHVVQATEGLSGIPDDQADRLETKLPNLHFHSVAGGHLVHYSNAPDVARIVRAVALDAGARSAA